MKRRMLTIIFIGLLFFSSVQAYTLKSMSEKISDTILLPVPELIEKNSFITVRYPISTSLIAEEGKPVLPRIIKTYRIPFGSKIQSINVYLSNTKNIEISKPIQLGGKTIPSTVDELDLHKNPIYPDRSYEYFTAAGREGNQLITYVTVICYPIKYIPGEHMLTYTTKIDISIKYISPSKPRILPDEYDLLIIAPNEFSQALQPLVDHKNNVGIKTILKTTEEIYQEYNGRDKPEQIKYCIKDMLENYGIKYVLLVGGLKSMVMATDRDDKNQGSKDWYLPVRYSNVITKYDPGMISDLYYADIYDSNGNFSSWDSNGDGIFGSFKSFASQKDIIDLFPEVAVGRLACRSISEVEIMVDKIITYETETYGSDWFKRFVLVGGDTFDDIDKYVEGEIETQKSYDYLADDGFEAIKIWASNRENGGLIPVAKDIVSTISNGCGFVHFAGHGSPELWNTHWVGGPFERNKRAQGIWWYHMMGMTNGYKDPIVVIGGCHNSEFNVTLTTFLNYWINKIYLKTGIEAFKRFEGSVYTPLPECFGWFFVRQKQGGAIATIGNTGTGYGKTGNSGDLDGDGIDDPDCIEGYGGYLETLFFKSIGVDHVEYLGDAWRNAISMYLMVYPGMKDQTDCKTVEQWVLLGDPSLKIGGYE